MCNLYLVITLPKPLNKIALLAALSFTKRGVHPKIQFKGNPLLKRQRTYDKGKKAKNVWIYVNRQA